MNAFCTVATPAYLYLTKALAKSLENSGNNETLYVLLISEEDFYIDLPSNIKICKINELSRVLPPNIFWYFDNFELCNSLKPFIVEWVFQQGFEKVIFLDSDIYPVSSFDNVWNALDNTCLMLTPHHIHPPSLDLQYINELAVLDMGIFNGGFAGWRKGVTTQQIIDWMCTRFPIYGFCARKEGMFVDQKLLPLLLQYFNESIQIERNPCLNVAFWNSHERDVYYQDNQYLIDNEPVIFFHMSGFRLSSPHLVCTYLSQKENDAIFYHAPWMFSILEKYGSLLRSISTNISLPSSKPFVKFQGIFLTSRLRRILFRKGNLSYQDLDVWIELIIDILKKVKQQILPYRNE